MKTTYILAGLALLTAGSAWAEDVPKDSLKVVDIEEVVVIAAPKENRKLRELPIAATLLSQHEMQAQQIHSVKNLTSVVPNLFIPDYGSKLTTAVYVRGIGSRVNTPSVGLYVDNIPYIEKAAFDFNYADIERIDILRGPQGTLYGRNTMGGLIKVHTKSPFTYQGTDVRLGAATHSDYNASLTHYHRISDHFAFSTGGFYEHTGGFFRNEARGGERIDRSNAGGGRFRGIYLPTSNLSIDMTLSYEHSDQGGYPYQYAGVVSGPETHADYIGRITNNDRSSYRRGLLNGGVNVEYRARRFILSSVTGYQHLKDRMFLDQDFSNQDIFTLEQRQRSHTLSQEFALKSKPGQRWQWATGASGFYQWLHTESPVSFGRPGIESLIEKNANRAFAAMTAGNPRAPRMELAVNNQGLPMGNEFRTPVLNGAIFHQSTFNDLLVRGLSLTLGLRMDYERLKMEYHATNEPLNFDFFITMPGAPRPMMTTRGLEATATYTGQEATDYVQWLPKVALQYEWKKDNSVYASLSKGYRSGGYNIQLFSDLLQGGLKNGMLDALAANPQMARFQATILSQKTEEPNIDRTTRYKPEYSWNYEVGSHLTLWQGKLWADLAAFYMDTRDQQISHFVASGLGRTTVNAGKSRSYGFEASLRTQLTDELGLNAGYGFTHATFREYAVQQELADGTSIVRADYKGKYVPFVPKHTLNVGAEYTIACGPHSAFDRVVLQANYNAAGRIYWTEQNNASQAFYGTLNWRANLEMGNASISFWARNFLNKEYEAFYFESMNKGIRQQGRPTQLGIELRCRF